MAAAGLLMSSAALVACGEDTPAVCGSADQLQSSFDDLKDIDITETNGLDEFKSQLETVDGDLDQLTNDAKSEFSTQVDAVTASFEATVRSFSPEAREAVRVAAPRLLRGIAAAHGVEVAVDFVDQYPPTVNDVDETAFAEQTVVAMFGHGRHAPLAAPFVGSEDFSRVLDLVPGSFIALGAVPAGMDAATAPFNHSPHARFDDAVLPDGAALYAELALRRLASQRSTPLTHRSSA